MKASLLSDNDLIINFASGDSKSLEVLIDRYQKKIFGYIYMIVNNRDVAEDIYQDTFVKVIHTIRSGQYNEEGKFIQWVMRIAHNLSIDYFRKENRMPTFSPSEDFDIFNLIYGTEPSKEDQMIIKQIHADVRGVIEHLPAEQKDVVYMRFYQNMSFKDIAERCDISINTALGRMRYALINIRKIVNEKNIILT
jgi:RNA polymerase sigma-70 factor (ECF subfamily)